MYSCFYMFTFPCHQAHKQIKAFINVRKVFTKFIPQLWKIQMQHDGEFAFGSYVVSSDKSGKTSPFTILSAIHLGWRMPRQARCAILARVFPAGGVIFGT